jgi:hypothetical protein
MQMGGASFRDPASIPELPLGTPPSAPQKRTSHKKTKPPVTAASQQTPADTGASAPKTPDVLSGQQNKRNSLQNSTAEANAALTPAPARAPAQK